MQPRPGKKPGINLGILFSLIGGGVALIAGVIILVVVLTTSGSSLQGDDKTTANGTGEQSGSKTATTEPSAAEEIVDNQFGFRFSVPSGFSRTDPPRAPPGWIDRLPPESKEYVRRMHRALYAFSNGPISNTNPPLIIQIYRLHGTIDPDQRLSEKDVPQVEGMHLTLEEPVRWKGYTLDVMKTRVDAVKMGMSPSNIEVVAYLIQFPLQGEAVQVGVSGPAHRETEVRAILKQSLNGFENLRPLPNSKKPAKDFIRKVAIIGGKLLFAVTLAAAGAVAIVISVRNLRRKRKQASQPQYWNRF